MTYNVLHRHQRKTESRPPVICVENFVKYRRVVFLICEWTDTQTDRHTDMLTVILRTRNGGKVTIEMLCYETLYCL